MKYLPTSALLGLVSQIAWDGVSVVTFVLKLVSIKIKIDELIDTVGTFLLITGSVRNNVSTELNSCTRYAKVCESYPSKEGNRNVSGVFVSLPKESRFIVRVTNQSIDNILSLVLFTTMKTFYGKIFPSY